MAVNLPGFLPIFRADARLDFSAGAKHLRHEFAEQSIETPLVTASGKGNDLALVEHLEAAFVQLRLQEPAHVRLDKDQRDLAPTCPKQSLEAGTKITVVIGYHGIASAPGELIHLLVSRIPRGRSPALETRADRPTLTSSFAGYRTAS